MPADQRSELIGASPRRKEDRPLVLGAGRFLDDLKREGMLYLGVVRSLHAHARLVGLGLEAASAAPGVVAVLAPKDLPEVGPSIPAPYGGVQHGRPFSQPVLATGTVRYVGEPVAGVVADDPYRLAARV